MQIEFTVPVRGRELEVGVEVSHDHWGNDGIGSYECNGYRGYDQGRDSLEEYQIDSIQVFSTRRKEYIEVPKDSRLFGLIAQAMFDTDHVHEVIEAHFEELARERCLVRLDRQ